MERVLTQTFGVVGAILEKDGKILLVQEAGGYDKGMWSHPAGWLEVGEDPIEAVKREVEEETGYAFTPTHLLGVYSLVRKDRRERLRGIPHPIKILFIGSIRRKGSVLHHDIAETRWFSPEEIDAMGHPPLRDVDIKKAVRDYFAGKRYPLELLSHTVSE